MWGIEVVAILVAFSVQKTQNHRDVAINVANLIKRIKILKNRTLSRFMSRFKDDRDMNRGKPDAVW